MRDIDGTNARYLALRRWLRPFVSRYVALSKDLQSWLRKDVRVRPERLIQIYNGVDTRKFCPREEPELSASSQIPAWVLQEGRVLVGTVGRLRPEKDQLTLVKAFIQLLEQDTSFESRLGLVLVGDGPMEAEIRNTVRAARLEDRVWFAGLRDDIPALLRRLDLFVLPSLGEGISNTILEAMASGLPVIATNVGGNPELVIEGETGSLVPPADIDALARCMADYVADDEMRARRGRAGRERVVAYFSIDGMVEGYRELYRGTLNRRPQEMYTSG
jgi:sugar transferase (PEP-CTERM/EpsH1 system associated)